MSTQERFDSFVCIGDTIQLEKDGFTLTARIAFDDCGDTPDARQDGFWPSLDKSDAGYIGEDKTRADLEAEAAKAQAIMDSWKAGDWFYCGIILSIAIDDTILNDHAASLWGIEANYPGTDNSYLSEVAEELVDEAIATGQAQLASLIAHHPDVKHDIVVRRYETNAAGWIGGVNNARLVGEDGSHFAAIFDADGFPVIIQEQHRGETGWTQLLSADARFEEISTRLILLWDEVMLEALS